MKEVPLIIRWGIPGTIFFGALFSLIGFDIFFEQNIFCVNEPQSIIQRMHVAQYFQGQSLVGIVALLIGGSIPLGFTISQLYYFGYWLGIPSITRRKVTKVLTMDGILQLETVAGTPQKMMEDWKSDEKSLDHRIALLLCHIIFLFPFLLWLIRQIGSRLSYDRWGKYGFDIDPISIRYLWVRQHHFQWAALMSWCREAARNNKDEGSRLDQLDNIYHGLGATFVAICLAWLAFFILHTYSQQGSLQRPSREIHSVTFSGQLAFDSSYSLSLKSIASSKMYAGKGQLFLRGSDTVRTDTTVLSQPMSKTETGMMLSLWNGFWKPEIYLSLLGVLLSYVIIWTNRGNVLTHQLIHVKIILKQQPKFWTSGMIK